MSEAPAAAPSAVTSTTENAAPAGASSQASSGQADKVQGSAQPASQTPTPTQAKAELKELAADNMDAMVAVKVGGQVKKMSVKDALKLAELGDGAQLRMQEAARARKEAEGWQRLARENPDEFLRRTGQDPEKYAEQKMVDKFSRLAETPEQKESRENREKLNKYEQEENGSKQTLISEFKNYLDNVPEGLEKLSKDQLGQALQYYKGVYANTRTELANQFVDAMKEANLPKDPLFGQWIANLMHASQVQKNAGQRDQTLQAKDAAAIVKQNWLSHVKATTGQMSPEDLHQLLGQETMKRLREFDVARVTGQKPAPVLERQNGPGQPASRNQKKSMDERAWSKHILDLAK